MDKRIFNVYVVFLVKRKNNDGAKKQRNWKLPNAECYLQLGLLQTFYFFVNFVQ